MTHLPYYIYVSDTKVDMLCSAIPQSAWRRLSKSMEIDLQVVKFTAQEKEQEPSESRYSKVRILEAFLSESDEVGSVDDPKGYFAGIMRTRWGAWSDNFDGNLAYFAASTRDSLVGLGGSTQHLIGNVLDYQVTKNHIPISTHRGILNVISNLVNSENTDYHSFRDGASKIARIYNASPVSEATVLRDVAYFTTSVHECAYLGPRQKMKFIAKRLFEVAIPENLGLSQKRLLVGSPIFVELLD